jgi:hypothetical protein
MEKEYKQRKNLLGEHRALITNWLSIWINTYIEIGMELEIFPSQRPLLGIDLTPFDTSYYDPMTQSIHFNIQIELWEGHFRVMQVFRAPLEKVLQVLPVLETNEFWSGFYGPDGTMAHELEHFRRHDDHRKGGSHSEARVDLPVGGNKIRHFGQCHADTMKSILQHNFYQRVWEAYNKKV